MKITQNTKGKFNIVREKIKNGHRSVKLIVGGFDKEEDAKRRLKDLETCPCGAKTQFIKDDKPVCSVCAFESER